MKRDPKLYFRDMGGKFDAVKWEALKMCDGRYDLTIYSLTPKGGTEPSHLVVRMTPAGNPDGYLSARRPDVKEADVSMLLLDYQALPAEELVLLCKGLRATFYSKTLQGCTKGYVALCGYDRWINVISVEEFFGIDPREDEPGARIYLRDKAHFMSMLSDPKKPAFSARSILSASEKAELKAFDMSRADIGNESNLNSLFCGYKSLCELDLSALDTTGVTEMHKMFCGCQSLRRLDLSTFDFSQVSNMKSMFGECTNLEEVILSDTVRRAGRIPHRSGARTCTQQELDELSRSVYITEGPQRAEIEVQRAIDNAANNYVRFGEATEQEVREYLGFTSEQKVKLTIVPHCLCRKVKAEPEPETVPAPASELIPEIAPVESVPEFVPKTVPKPAPERITEFVPKNVSKPVPKPVMPADDSYEQFIRSVERQKKKIGCCAWAITAAVFIIAILITLWVQG